MQDWNESLDKLEELSNNTKRYLKFQRVVLERQLFLIVVHDSVVPGPEQLQMMFRD